ncbi:MAG: MBL fold metallo-hydrolase [Clostridiales Family XIII bacterium]|jgi:glyoxylase-like metal-dependent hydrolase (beta-lactamase superfamily II)|nr:MBL fold metallo-hydrolase [Clostridiales Family XIII bacterium]
MIIRNYPGGIASTNNYLVSDENGAGIIVDAGYYSPALVEAAKSEGLKVELLMLTHGHNDHIAGVEAYLKAFKGCRVVIGEDEIPIVTDPFLNLSIEFQGKEIALEADLYVKDGDRLTVGDLDISIISTPGHTPGGVSILVNGALFSGDTLFQNSIGRTDLYGGNYETLAASIIDKLFLLPDETVVYPGHMGITTIGHERRHNPFLWRRA